MIRRSRLWMIAALFCICGATVFTASSSDNNDNLNHRWEGNDGAEYRSPFYATFQMTKVMNITGGQSRVRRFLIIII